MSDPFANADAALFASPLGCDATVQRGAGAPVPMRVIKEDGVARLGDYGQVIGRVRMVSFNKAVWSPQRGDVVTITADGSVQTVEALEEDDGYVVKVVVSA